MTPSSTFTSRWFFGGLIYLASLLSAFASPVKFDIPSQPAPAALQLFIKQSGVQVMYVADDLKDVTAHAVTGNYEPAAALALILKDTGFTVAATKAGGLTVIRDKAPAAPGAIKGSLTGEGGKPLAGVLVSIRETAQSADTDRFGQYIFPNVAAGTYVLVASTSGYQTMHITDVQVKAGNELTLGNEEMRKHLGDVTALEPYVVHGDIIEQLTKYEITEMKTKPFTTANVDIPRTVNDVQPYYIFDSQKLEQSGAVNVEDFLKQRLTMNTASQTNSQQAPGLGISGDSKAGTSGTASSINLRGLGQDKTLILINGRRRPGTVYYSVNGLTYGQPDVNGIPLSSIDRIEVLPSSASGIYGASAVGGVINIILKKNYQGGELRYSYGNTTDTDAPIQTVSGSYGFSFENGRTEVLLDAQYSEANPLLMQDRLNLVQRGLNAILKNSPGYLYSNSRVFSGSATNIASSSAPLILRNGTPLNSNITYVSRGAAPGSDISAGLLANAGKYDLNLSPGTGSNGLLSPIGNVPRTKSVRATINRQMTQKIDIFAEFSIESNVGRSLVNPLTGVFFNVSPLSPINPFQQRVSVAVPSSLALPYSTESNSKTVTLGTTVKLPYDWTSEADFTWGRSNGKYSVFSLDSTAYTADIIKGTLNPFVDTIAYPLDMARYYVPIDYTTSSTMEDIALRASGPLGHFLKIDPALTIGLEHRKEGNDPSVYAVTQPITTADSNYHYVYAQTQSIDSIYGELTIPVITPKRSIPGVRNLEFQVADRTEQYTVDAGTIEKLVFPNRTPPRVTYSPSDRLGNPLPDKKASYLSNTQTIGLKYEPISDVIFRASFAKAYIPPTYAQLLPNPVPSLPSTVLINDPKTGTSYSGYVTTSGGNPNLKPEHDKNWDLGLIYAPKGGPFKNLRIDLEYYHIRQLDHITSISAQQAINDPQFSDRITRDSSTGLITMIDLSSINATEFKTAGWDLSIDYQKSTPIGTFDLYTMGSLINYEKRRLTYTNPSLDYVGYPSNAGAAGGEARAKANTTLTWQYGKWTAGWTASWFSGYKQSGAPGDPNYYGDTSNPATRSIILAQGGFTIPSQMYHDVFVSYAIGRNPGAGNHRLINVLAANTTIQLGVKNVFNTLPPFDAFYAPYYFSPYGDARLRNYTISIRRSF